MLFFLFLKDLCFRFAQILPVLNHYQPLATHSKSPLSGNTMTPNFLGSNLLMETCLIHIYLLRLFKKSLEICFAREWEPFCWSFSVGSLHLHNLRKSTTRSNNQHSFFSYKWTAFVQPSVGCTKMSMFLQAFVVKKKLESLAKRIKCKNLATTGIIGP